jgi:hypothetical protein
MAVESSGEVEEDEEEEEEEATAEEERDASGGAKALGCVGDRSGDRREKVIEDTPSVRSGGSDGGSTLCARGGSEVGAARAGAVSAAGTA